MRFLTVLLFVAVAVNAAPTEDGAPLVIGDTAYEYDPRVASRNANANVRKWDNGIIPYAYDAASGYTDAEKDVITKALRKIEAQTDNCLRFKERTTEADYVLIQHTTTGCNSYVGRIYSQPQRLSLQRNIGCVHPRVVIHEFLHASGFEHEQCRYDRDQYIKVVYENIQEGLAFAFDTKPEASSKTFGIPYDYYSIMHYDWKAFSSNGRATIIPRDLTVDLNKMGATSELSASDIKKIKMFYNCPL